ncbi:MAG TPA: tRNA preQ1(34) S-adenosylmethionine ribosyltransferase-isomerase QueA [Stellaceae bacterium]|nr:tRNA preQ1(34) S-adenosylmethionine ribosyltransferase-isomerase QueA [Stellaceae bacterium]
MRVDEFDFPLPRHLVAERPCEPRDAARLLVIGDTLEDRVVADLPRLLRAGDVMVFNDTRVIPARLVGLRGAARIEVTLHRDQGGGHWRAFAKGARRLAPGDRIVFGEGFAAHVLTKHTEGDVTLGFDLAGAGFRAALERFGHVPLPPYIKRPAQGDPRDRRDYQTMFARSDGAVAAPTAGLHFTPRLVAALEAAGIEAVMVTLHVGAGTFLPVKAADTADHHMHAEHGIVTAAAADRLNAVRAQGGRIVAAGTTSLRLLESAVGADGRIAPFAGETSLFITPGYRFRAVDRLFTNFHLPRSTLFMLVAAFAGLERMKRAYAHAVDANYRFFSYGDACLIAPARAAS